ncbi:hypothetical protein ACQ4PT_062671 [Festuca glaucescens]
MANPQCCANPPTPNHDAGEGKVVESFGGLRSYLAKRFEAPNLRNIADKVASSGYFVVVPDFFHGNAYVPGDDVHVWIKEHTTDKGFEEAKPVIDVLKEQGVSVVGAAGYCWGAKVVAELAKANEIQAAVMLHPSFITDDDIKEVKCPIAILGAETDVTAPPEQVKQFEQVLSSSNTGVCSPFNQPHLQLDNDVLKV